MTKKKKRKHIISIKEFFEIHSSAVVSLIRIRPQGVMKNLLVLCFLATAFAVTAAAGNNYLWGEVGAKDTLIGKVTVSKLGVVGITTSTKYVFKQKVFWSGV